MKKFKINGVRYINSAIEKGVFKLTVGITGDNDTNYSVALDIEPDQIMNKTLAELEEMAIRKLNI